MVEPPLWNCLKSVAGAGNLACDSADRIRVVPEIHGCNQRILKRACCFDCP